MVHEQITIDIRYAPFHKTVNIFTLVTSAQLTFNMTLKMTALLS